MKIDIFDVGHGNCALVTCPNGKRIMVDCGYRSDPSWFPSVALAGQSIDLLVFSNLDEDHVGDLPRIWHDMTPGSILSNPSVTAPALATMKSEHGMGYGVRQAYAILRSRGTGLTGRPADFGLVNPQAYYNRYRTDFTDTNNLSLAFFVSYGTFTILFAGDLETAGWRALLKWPDFRRNLASVNILVASHHGRANGQCEEVFDICRPDIVVFSDDRRQYDSQDTDDWYRARTKGIVYPTSFHPSGKRHVFTTRHDGSMQIDAAYNGGFLVTPERTMSGGTLAKLLAESRRQPQTSLPSLVKALLTQY